MFRRVFSTATATATETATAAQGKKGIPRFWKAVTIASQQERGTSRILLDGRPVRCPSGSPLDIPASHSSLLPLLVAGEWEAQRVSLKSYSLPLVRAMRCYLCYLV